MENGEEGEYKETVWQKGKKYSYADKWKRILTDRSLNGTKILSNYYFLKCSRYFKHHSSRNLSFVRWQNLRTQSFVVMKSVKVSARLEKPLHLLLFLPLPSLLNESASLRLQDITQFKMGTSNSLLAFNVLGTV